MHYLLSVLRRRDNGHLRIVRTRPVLGIEFVPAAFTTHGEERGAFPTIIDDGAVMP